MSTQNQETCMSKFISVIFFTYVFIIVNGQSHYKNLNPCAVRESRDSALCGSFLVYENRITKQGRKIGLNIIVIPALNKNSNQPPIFFFDGGPGIGTTKNASWFAEKIILIAKIMILYLLIFAALVALILYIVMSCNTTKV